MLGGSGRDHAAWGTPRAAAKAGEVPAPDTNTPRLMAADLASGPVCRLNHGATPFSGPNELGYLDCVTQAQEPCPEALFCPRSQPVDYWLHPNRGNLISERRRWSDDFPLPGMLQPCCWIPTRPGEQSRSPQPSTRGTPRSQTPICRSRLPSLVIRSTRS